MNFKTNKFSLLSELEGRLSFKYLLITLSIILCNVASAQTTEVDSLRTALTAATSDSERVVLMSELSSKLKNIDSKQALIHAQNVLKLTQKTNDKEQEVNALYHLGKLVYDTPERDSALVYFEKSERIAEELGLHVMQASNLMSIANYYRYRNTGHKYSNIDSAKTVKYLMKSVAVSKAGNYDYGTGRSYAKLASFYTRYNQIGLSESYLELAAEYYLRLDKGNAEIASYYNEVGDKIWDFNPKQSMDFYLKGLEYASHPNIKVNLAKAHNFIGEPKIALKYLNEAIPNLRKLEKPRMLGIAFAQLAEVHIPLGDFKAANKATDDGIALLNPLGRSKQRALPALYRVKGNLMEYEGNNKAALAYYTKSLNEANRIKHRFDLAKAHIAIGKLHLLSGSKEGEQFCQKALINTKRNNQMNLEIEACDCLYNIYKKENNKRKALAYLEQKIALTDSLSTLNVKHALETNSKIAQKNKRLAEQSYQQKINDEQIRIQTRFNTALLFSSIIGFFLILILSMSIKKIRKQNIEITRKTNELENTNLSLGHSNEELERFAYIASHDLKSPLNNIINFTRLLRKNLGNETKPLIIKSLDFMEKSGKKMDQLIVDILEYSKLSNQDISNQQPELIRLNKLVAEISELTINNIDGKSVNIDASNLPDLRWNYSKIFLLFKNLIENGLKYNESSNPTVKLYSTKTKDIHSIYIQDNGIGIKKEYYDKIFIMFQRLHNQSEYEGTGLGLATCKKIVDEFEGKISISSELGKGTTFKIELPNHLIHSNAVASLNTTMAVAEISA